MFGNAIAQRPQFSSSRHRKQRGLFGGAGEQQMVLASAAVVVAAVVAIAYGVLGRSRAQAEFEEVNGLVNNIRDIYNGQSYTGDIVTTLQNLGRLGNAQVLGANEVGNNFGGSITISGGTTNFSLLDTNIPLSDCVTILTLLPSVGYSTVTAGSSSGTTVTPPVSVTSAQTACNSSNANQITFTAQ